MYRLKSIFLILLVMSMAAVYVMPAQADGIIIPEPPICDPGPCREPFPISQLAIEYHHVDVTIENQVAITHVDQVFRNDNDWTVEGTYVFPIPPGASVTQFTLWIDGKAVEGEILERDEARDIYEDIVRTLRDPALLEYLEQGAMQASIFPIEPGQERRIELEYTEVLQIENGLVNYRYPLNTEKFSTEPLEDVRVSVDVKSPHPVRAIYSPTHKIDINRDNDYRFDVTYEENDVKPDTDFELIYSVTDEDIGLNLITYRDPDEKDGFFLLLAAPSVEENPNQRIPKDVFVVLDRSGSMDGEKFIQAQEALIYILDHLHADDRFNIIAFSSGTRAYEDNLQPADEADQAKDWVYSLSAAGSTDINLALLEALAQVERGRSTIILFLTDGLPTEGVTDSEEIITNIQKEAPDNVRLFAFGVGYDVDTFLLDTLSGNMHGATTYVTPDEAIDETVSAFYAKVSTPVLTDIELDFGDVITYDLYPDPLPDLFAGSQLVLVGRYKNSGGGTIELSGWVEGRRVTYEYEDHTFRSRGGSDFLPRLWATRKIGALLNQVRLQGANEELVDQIVQLSIRYGIVTPYTSYLVTEHEMLGAEAQQDIADNVLEEMESEPAAVTGFDAFERAAAEGEYKDADVPLAPSEEVEDLVRIAGTRTYRLLDGVWVDTSYDPENMDTVRIPFLSDDYFALADARSDLAAGFALGDRVIAVADGVAYEVVSEDSHGDDVEITIEDMKDSNDSEETSPSIEEQDENKRSHDITLPCPGAPLMIGIALVPLARKKWSKKD
jgi:Ca-activated chloride channel family protein